MADTYVQLTIDDSSPSVAYSPFRDTLGAPNPTAGWNPYYDPNGYAASPGQLANGTSLHITSLNGAALAVQWTGTGVQLFGNTTNAAYTVTLDGVPITPFPNASTTTTTSPTPSASSASGLLADIQGLPDVPHTITLTALISPNSASGSTADPAQVPFGSSMLVFDKAVILSSPVPTSNITFQPQTLADSSIAYSGQWSFETSANLGFHKSVNVGDRAFTRFNGTTLAILGRTSPLGANYTVTLDNGTLPFSFPASSLTSGSSSVSTTLSARSSFQVDDALLFFVTGLEGGVHSVEVRNNGFGDSGNGDGGIGDGQAELMLRVDGFRVNVPVVSPIPTPTTSPVVDPSTFAHNPSFPTGTIVAFVLAGILAFLLFSGLLFFFCVWRPRQRRKRLEKKARASGFGPDISGWTVGAGALGGSGGVGGGGSGGSGPKRQRRFPFTFRRTRVEPDPTCGPGVMGVPAKDMEELRMEFIRPTPPLIERDVDLADDGYAYTQGYSYGSHGRSASGFGSHAYGSSYGYAVGAGLATALGISSESAVEDEKGQELDVDFEEYGYGNGSRNGNGGNGNGHGPRSRTGSSAASDSTMDSSTRRAIARARERSKGKARQVMGMSWSQSFTLDLPGVISGSSGNGGKRKSRKRRSTTSGYLPQPSSPLSPGSPSEQISSFAAADPPSPEGARARWDTHSHSPRQRHQLDHPPSYAASVSNRDSNGSSAFAGPRASVPRSVSQTPENRTPQTAHAPMQTPTQTQTQDPSTSPVQLTYPRAQTHQRQSSQGFLLADEEDNEPEQGGGAPEGQAETTSRALERRDSRPLPRPPSSLYSQSPAYTQSPPSTSETKGAAHSQHASPAEVVPPRPLPSPEGRDRSSSTATETGPSGSSLRQVIRSLRPRTVHAQPRQASYASYVHLYDPPRSAGHERTYSSSLGSEADFASLYFSSADVRPASTVAEEEESTEGRPRGGPPVDSPTLGGHEVPAREPPSPLIQSPLPPPPRRADERERTPRKPLPRTPTGTDYASASSSEGEKEKEREEGVEVEVKDGAFLDVRQTSPFRVDFGSDSVRERPRSASVVTRPISMVIPPPTTTTGQGHGQQTTTDDSSPGQGYSTAPSRLSENRPSRRSSLGSLSAAAHQGRMPEFVQGTSRAPFRLTTMTIPTSVTPPKNDSNSSSGGMTGTSFLDLTSSREGSVSSRSKSVKTTGSGQSGFFERPFGGNGNGSGSGSGNGNGKGASALGGDLKSRWSNTTVPSVSTRASNLGPVAESSVPGLILPERKSTGLESTQSQMASPSKSAEMDESMSIAASSTFPIPGVQVNIPPSPHHIMDFGTVQDEPQPPLSALSAAPSGAGFPTSPLDPADSQRLSTQSQFTHATNSTGLSQAGAHLHVHPAIDLDTLSTGSGSGPSARDPQSPTDSIPVSIPISDLNFMTSDSDHGLSQRDSRRTTESSLAFHHALLHPGRRSPSPNTEGRQAQGVGRSQPASPSAVQALRSSSADPLRTFTPGPRRDSPLASRALGLPTPSSTMTLRTHGGRSPHPFANVSSVHDGDDDDDDRNDFGNTRQH
ncbi:unnamed protein product [Cyclocybe aegerita]|uniref:Uncharacterized protein n=1 Tax=Cyclocybe aegerita TaxID=1973307 RepID=A0A8S0WFH4_CYCAE|nr:unnamed protein product [Cyclocybe aegerita]